MSNLRLREFKCLVQSREGGWEGQGRVSLGQGKAMAHALVQDSNLILHAAFLALQGLLGNAFDGHQLLRPFIFCQDHLREGPPMGRGDS